MSAEEKTEPFPALSPVNTATNPQANAEGEETTNRDGGRRRSSVSSSIGRASHQASILSRQAAGSVLQSFMNSNPPLGMWQATGEVAAQIPTLPEIKNGSFSAEGWSHEGQMEHRGSNPHEIHRKRKERTSSATTRTRRTTTGSKTPGTIHETVEYFPAQEAQDMGTETKRVPTTINEMKSEDSRPYACILHGLAMYQS